MERIVVGVDGSASSSRAIAWAKDEAEVRGATLHLVCVVEDPSSWIGAGAVMTPTAIGVLSAEDLHAAGKALIAKATGAAGLDSGFSSEVLVGYPTEKLIEASKDAGMLVLGSDGHRAKSALLGSVAMHCVHHSACPIVILPKAP